MGGGSGCGYAGIHEGKRNIILELSVDKETVLWMEGISDVDNFYENTEIINWGSGGSSIGVYLSPGEKTLAEQQSAFCDCAYEKFPDRSYDINVKVGVLV